MDPLAGRVAPVVAVAAGIPRLIADFGSFGSERRAHQSGPSMNTVAKSVAKSAQTGIRTKSREYVEKLWSNIRSRKVLVSTNPVQLATTRTTSAPSTNATTHASIRSGIRA